MTLDDYLDGAYCERVLHAPKANATLADFKGALAADADLRRQAATKRTSLTDDICKRCYVSKIHRDALADVLSA